MITGVKMRESYRDFLRRTGNEDSKTAWKWWKIQVYEMSEVDAMRDADNNYRPLKANCSSH